MTTAARLVIERLGRTADVRMDGERPWDIEIRDPRIFRRVLLEGSIGFGEGYVEGWWTTRDLEELAYRLARARLERATALMPRGLAHKLSSLARNQQTRQRSLRVAREHYNYGNDLFCSFLGARKVYSCGYFHGTEDLDVAQEQKLDLICKKLELKPGEHLLDVGSGFGAFAHHAASRYGVRVTSVNISEEQIRYARDLCRGLDVEVVRCDYRDLKGTFDKVAAIAMFTHVGTRNYRTFMETMHRVLAPGGIFVMEGIWGNISLSNIDAWLDKYIFPGGVIPSGAQTFKAFEGLFVAEDVHNYGPDYTATLRAWNRNFQAAWPELQGRYDEKVRRIFEFYFLICAGAFRARVQQNWQLVLTPVGRPQPACRVG